MTKGGLVGDVGADVSDKPAFRQTPLLTAAEVAGEENWYRKSSELVVALDDSIASLINELQAKGVLDNTVVMLTSDNGVFFGEHRISSGKFHPFEESVRVPLVVRGPGFPGGVTEPRPVANVDLAPTIVTAGGASAGRVTDGRALQALVASPTVGVGRPIALETGPLWGRRYYRGVRTTQYKYIEQTTGERELYDLVADPGELQNRADDPALASVQTQLRNLTLGLRHCAGAACLNPSAPTGTAPPIADAGDDFEVAPRQPIYLAGLDSFDPDGGALIYKWSVLQGGMGLISADQPAAISSAPATFQTLVYRLTVTDPTGRSASDDVTVKVTYPYHQPIANAGPDQIVRSRATGYLTGSASTEVPGGALTYLWTQVGGPAVTIQNAATAYPTFTAPATAGTLTFQLKVTDSANRIGTDTVVVTDSGLTGPMPVTVTASNLSTVYGQAVPTPGSTSTGAVAAVAITSPTCSTNAAALPAVGSYLTSCSGLVSDANYAYTYVKGTLTVAKSATAIALTMTPTAPVVGQFVTVTATVSAVAPGSGNPGSYVSILDGTKNLITASPVGGKVTFTTSSLTVGTHALTANILVGGSYLGSTSPIANLTVAKAPVTITAASASIKLGDPVPAIGYSATGAVAGLALTAPVCSAAAVTAAGIVATTCTGPTSDASYVYTYVPGSLAVGKLPVTITAGGGSISFGAPVPAIGSVVTGARSGIPITTPTCALAGGTPPGPGSYPTMCTGPASDVNYVYTYAPGSFTVGKAPVTVTADNLSMVLGDVLASVGFSTTGAVPGVAISAVTCSTVAGPQPGPGWYATSCIGPVSDANYLYTYVHGVLSVGKAAVTVTADSPSMVLGENVPPIGFHQTGAAAGVAISAPVCSSETVTGVGQFATTCVGPGSDPNYVYAYVDGSMTVGKARVTITATSPIVGLGDPVPSIGYTTQGTVGSLAVTEPACASDEVTGVGSYATRCTGPASDVNYQYDYVDGLLSVRRAAVTVTAASASIRLGDPVPSVGYTAVGALPTLAITGPVCSAGVVVGAGSVTTKCVGPAVDDNYVYQYVDGVLSVGEALVTVTASSAAIVLGQPIPPVGFAIAGARAGVPVTAPVCGAAAVTGAGSVPTHCVGPAADANYVYDYEDGSLLVAPATVTISGSSQSMVFGDPVPSVGYDVVGAVPGIDITEPVCTSAAGSSPGPGSYATACTGPASDANYVYFFEAGTLDVARAAVTVIADGATINSGDPVPPIGYSVQGAVAGVPITDPSCSVESVTGPGSFITSCAGPSIDDDYTYTYVDGVLSVGVVTITADSASMVLGEVAPAVGYRATGTVAGVAVTDPVCASAAVFGAGSVATTCVGVASDANYAYRYEDGVLSVAKAAVLVTADSGSMTLGDSVPVVGFTAVGAATGVAISEPVCAVSPVTGAGSVATHCVGPVSDADYLYTYVDGVLSVAKASVTVTAASPTSVLGAPLAPVGFSAAGTVPGVAITPPECSAPTVAAVGAFVTSCVGPLSDANYVYAYVDGVLSVAKAPVTVTASSPSMVLGGLVPAVGFAVVGAVSGIATVVPSCSAGLVSGAGVVATHCVGPLSDANYVYAYVDGVLSVAKAPVTVTASSASIVFGQTIPSITAATAGTVPGVPTVTFTCGATAPVIAPPSSYPTVCTGPATDANYLYSYAGGSLLVSRAAVQVTASSPNLVFGQSVPTITATFSGVVSGTTPASPTCTAATSAAVGTYGTSCAGVASDARYTYTYVGGTVTIARASTATVVAASPAAPVYGQSLTLTATTTVVAPGAGISGSPVTFYDGTTVLGSAAGSGGRATLAVASLAAGTHAVKAVSGQGGNFAASTSPVVTVTINKALTTTSLAVPLPIVATGQAQVLTATVATVAPGTGVPGSAVTFYDGTAVIGSASATAGKATLSATFAAAGDHVISAAFGGGGNFAASTSSATTITVVALPAYQGTGPKLAFIGDSIIYSGGTTLRSTFSPSYLVSVLGLTGRRIEDLQTAATAYAGTKPAKVVINLGTNDAVDPVTPTASADASLSSMAAKFPTSCVAVMTIAEHTSAPTNGSKQGGPVFNAAAHAMNLYIRSTFAHVVDWDAALYAHMLADPAKLDPWMLPNDQIHPSQSGFNAMAQLVSASLQTC